MTNLILTNLGARDTLVPTLRVGTHPRPLRGLFPPVTPNEEDAERPQRVPTRSVGTREDRLGLSRFALAPLTVAIARASLNESAMPRRPRRIVRPHPAKSRGLRPTTGRPACQERPP
jgi:hypothetical protein